MILMGLLGVSQPVSAANGKLVNISTRALVETGDEVMIGGFIIADSPKTVLVQARGTELANDDPSLTDLLADPVLSIISNDTGEELMANDNWEDSQGQDITEAWNGSPNLMTGSLSAAAIITLDPGNYTAIVRGKNATAGLAQVEVYDLDSVAANGRLVNISTRALVETGDEVMIGGFIIADSPKMVLVQARGTELANDDPSLTDLLADPVLSIISNDTGEELMANDNWEDSQGQDITEAWNGSPNLMTGSLSAAAIITLDPGNYTAIVRGKNATAGLAQVEVYDLDSPGSGDPEFEVFSGLRIGDDGSVTLRVGGITLSAGNTGCISGGANLNGLFYDYHWTAWQHNTGSGWMEVSDSRQTEGLCGYDLTSAPPGKYRLVGDMTLAGVRGLYMSENEVNVGGGADTRPSFAANSGPSDQTYIVGTAIDTLTLPEASDGDGTLTYNLSPEVPGLTFDPSTRQFTGTPTMAGTHAMTYTVTDEDDDTDTLTFTITVEPDNTPVTISDTNLRAVIEDRLGKASGAPITSSEMATLTDLNARNSDIRDLTGLEFATNLAELNLFRNSLTELSPLSGLTNLKKLDFGHNNVTDVSPLSSLISLEELVLGGNNITNVSPLSGLINLTSLYLVNNNITDVSDLSGLINLEELVLGGNNITDVSDLSGLINLQLLYLHYCRVKDLSPLSGLTNLKWLNLVFNEITDVSALSGLTNLTTLNLGNNSITNITPLSGLTNLTILNLGDNSITDITALSGLTNLGTLNLENNSISDLAPLAANTGLGSRDEVDVRVNPLSATSINVHVPTLEARGVSVSFDETIVFTDPQIYNDNVFVLPVTENLAAAKLNTLPLDRYATRFYDHFSDSFDFLIFFSSLNWDQLEPEAFKGAFHLGIGNDVQGIGKSSFFRARFGTAGKLQSVLFFSRISSSNSEHSYLVLGPMLHELMHRWANSIVKPAVHWDYSSANGILGGFDITTLVDHGGGRYSAPNALTGGWTRNLKPYSPIELYLAGLLPPEEVPDLWVAADGKFIERADGRDVFTASQVRTFTIEDIIAEHGARVPDHTQSQKAFRAAVILLVSEDYPAIRQSLDALSNDATLFSHAGEDQFDDWYNFYEGTGGRATIAMDGLSQFKSTAAVKRPTVRSFGTPPPPIHSLCECEH